MKRIIIFLIVIALSVGMLPSVNLKAEAAENAKTALKAESEKISVTKTASMEAASAAILENVLRRLPDEGEDTVVFRIL